MKVTQPSKQMSWDFHIVNFFSHFPITEFQMSMAFNLTPRGIPKEMYWDLHLVNFFSHFPIIEFQKLMAFDNLEAYIGT